MSSSISDNYQVLSDIEHILLKPGMYVGSSQLITEDMYIIEDGNIVKKSIKYIPALQRLYEEILLNAFDQTVRDGTDCSEIHVNIDKELNTITVHNNGQGLPIVLKEELDCYIPEMVFGMLRSGSNYSDEDRITGGTNGLGAKCISLDTLIPMFNGTIKFAKDINIGDELIGDDGNKRVVLNTVLGTGKMYEISQIYGENYKVNDEHILTLHLPDSKKIFWNSNGWSVLWWNNETKSINTKFIKAYSMDIICPECKMVLNSSLKRHYSRQHKNNQIPIMDRKSPCKLPDMTNEKILKSYNDMVKFVNNIPDDNTIDISIKDYINLPKTVKSRLAGVRGECVNWDYKNVALDPYILGLWLGDGSSDGYRYAGWEDNDPELFDYLRKWGESNDAQFKQDNNNKYNYSISSINNFHKKGFAPLRNLLKKYNLINNKHIPKEYLVNSKEVRLQVLAGIIDTDGYVSRDGARIVITQGIVHKKLIYDTLYLARSLGFCCSINCRLVKYKLEDGTQKESNAYFVNISGNIESIPTLLPRKKCNNTKSINTDKTTGRITINDIEDNDYIGIHIDGNQRFLINDFIVTHNCTNIFSTSFILETADSERKKLYLQEWKNNMSEKSDPKITSLGRKKPYTTITFQPDLKYFKIKTLTDDMIALMEKRLIDIGFASHAKIKTFYNGENKTIKKTEDYMKLYCTNEQQYDTFMVDSTCERWTVGIMLSSNGFNHTSFVNGIHASLGGSHVDHVMASISKEVIEKLKTKKIEIKPSDVKNKLFVFLKSTIVNPIFDSQTKECLKMTKSKFGSEYIMSDTFKRKLLNSDLLKLMMNVSESKLLKDLSKTSGTKTSRLIGIKGLEDANFAGTSKSSQTKLILTEGLSAKTFAMSAITVIGRDRFGIFPLKGKPLNVRGTAIAKVTANAEICNIVKILGLKYGEKYTDMTSLRYGGVIALADSDVDGNHICSLILNIFHYFWPELLAMGYLGFCSTPIVKVYQKKETLTFYTLNDYESWLEQNTTKQIKTKYFKGLGTSTAAEAREALENIDTKIITFDSDELVNQTVNLAFDKKQTNERKLWLMERYDPKANINRKMRDVSVSDYINKELIHFSYYDNQRSIPNVMDGLKPSQRKILYTAIKYLTNSEMKVAQFGAKVAEKTDYHHGEASLMGAVVNMAQTYVGSNNINLLEPKGAFGCLDPDTEILLWSGKSKKAKDIEIDDELVGDDGTKRIVQQLTNGIDDMFKITLANGMEFIANSQHKLTLRYRPHKQIYWKESHKTWRFSYIDNNRIKSKTVSISESGSVDTYNKSTLSKDEAFLQISEYANNITTSEIIDIKICDYMKLSKSNKIKMQSLVNSNVIDWNYTLVEIDPYVLGIWLGDGNSDASGIAGSDIEVIQAYALWLDTIGCELVHDKNGKDHENAHYSVRTKTKTSHRTSIGDINHSKETCIGCQTSTYDLEICNWKFEKADNYNITCNGVASNDMRRDDLSPHRELLKRLNLYKNKHIPEHYINNSKEVRLQLLAGIIDTDGCVKYQTNTNILKGIAITQSNRLRAKLIDDIYTIIISLGFKGTIGYVGLDSKTSKGEDMSIKTLFITGDNLDTIPMRVNRKQIEPYTRTKYTYGYSFEVKSIGKGKFNGWELDGNHRFLLRNGLITHNSRIVGGNDAASPRYIFTQLSDIAKKIFDSRDSQLLNYLESDGMIIEPKWFAPVIPMILVNGAIGIGSGFSTEVLQYNPVDICNYLSTMLEDNKPVKNLKPWYRGFNGTVERLASGKYRTIGCYEFNDTKRSLTVTELPIGVWTDDYKDFIEAMFADKDDSTIADIRYGNSDVIVNIEIIITPREYGKIREMDVDDLLTKFKLSSKLSCTNMYLFNHEGTITKYNNVYEILKEFYLIRLDFYIKRRDAIIAVLKYELMILSNKVKFIEHVKAGKIKLQKIDDKSLLAYLINNEFDQDHGVYGEPIDTPTLKEFAYMIDMPIRSITNENAEKFKQQQISKQEELDRIIAQTAKDMWKLDLQSVVEANNKAVDDLVAANTSSAPTKSSSKSRRSKK